MTTAVTLAAITIALLIGLAVVATVIDQEERP